MFLSDKQIKDYQNDGVIIVRDIFKDWIEPLRKGFQKVLNNPSKHGRENVNDDNGRFFEDYCNWERIEEFKNCIFNSPGAQIVAEATNSKSAQIFHEHIFIKEPGTNLETPWHQDMPYYCVDGNDTGSFWIPLDQVDKKNNLQLILGSHKWSKLIKPTKWSNDQSWYKDDTLFMSLPSSEEFEKNILIPELSLGDAALYCDFGKEVNKETNSTVIKYFKTLKHRRIIGINNLTPSYNKLIISYDLKKTNFKDIKKIVEDISIDQKEDLSSNKIEIPVCCEKSLSLDIERLEKKLNLNRDKIFDSFFSKEYFCYMTGFIAGMPFLGDLEDSLRAKRLETPRVKVPKGSVGLTEQFANIYTSESPGGWNII